MLKLMRAFFPSVLVAYIAAVALGTWGVLDHVASFGVPVSFDDRIAAIWHDLMGMVGSYLPLICIALLIALWIGQWSQRRWLFPRLYWLTLAGFIAVVVLLLIMEMALGLQGIAAARTLPGLIGQGLAGALGGWAFARLTSDS
jgi:hypothetical protein